MNKSVYLFLLLGFSITLSGIECRKIGQIPAAHRLSELQLKIWEEQGKLNQVQISSMEIPIVQELSLGEINKIDHPVDQNFKPYIFETKSGTVGIWKPDQGSHSEARSEIAAYKLDRVLGLNITPTTAIRWIDELNMLGSAQLFIQDAYVGFFYETSPLKLRFFDWLIDNRDRHEENYLVKNGKIIAIDNANSFYHSNLDWDRKVSYLKQLDDMNQAWVRLNLLETLAPGSPAEKAIYLKNRSEVLSLLAVLLPPQRVFQRLKELEEKFWLRYFKGILVPQQLEAFLVRRLQVINKIEELEKLIGSSVFPSGEFSELIEKM